MSDKGTDTIYDDEIIKIEWKLYLLFCLRQLLKM
jgi:hypothetical protein